MMINKRLINMVKESKKYIFLNVLFQWISLIASILIISLLTLIIKNVYLNQFEVNKFINQLIIILILILVKFFCTIIANKMSFYSSDEVKKTLRHKIYQKLLKLGPSYKENVNTSEAVQVTVEGVDQLENYFGSYLPQLFYALLAPITLFIVTSFIDFKVAIVLFVCVPLIPVSIIIVQKFAKKLLQKYWGQYTTLGDNFLENLQGLTTLKIYQADEFKQQEMDKQAEKFRRITMKVLTMQLNSITIMDLVAYGGAAIGIILGLLSFAKGNISLNECLFVILISADFFLPMRLLGSFFHIAMNGMAASEKMFKILDIEENTTKNLAINDNYNIEANNLKFSYDNQKIILDSVSLKIPQNSLTAIVGKSGCGKSTLASIIAGKINNYENSIAIGNLEIKEINQYSLMQNINYVGYKNYLFKGTIKENLLIAKPEATDDELWQVLDRVKISSFLKSEKGLETNILENASNLSGGQCQRICLARAILFDSPIYIFDEATSNIDIESENDIMNEIINLAKKKTVILISHRLANVVSADNIFVMNEGKIIETGKHNDLLNQNGFYNTLWNTQYKLEN